MQAPTAAAAATTILRAFHLPAPGTHWLEQGGIFAGLMLGPKGETCALIVAAGPAAHFAERTWGEWGKTVEGADSTHDGQANTQAMAAASLPLAQDIQALEIAGFKDWYLPSQAELQLCRVNASSHFETDIWYWSSTQYSPSYAWVQGFEGGYSYVSDKDYEFRAVAVRRLVL